MISQLEIVIDKLHITRSSLLLRSDPQGDF